MTWLKRLFRFRAAHHRLWFQLSMFVLGLCLILTRATPPSWAWIYPLVFGALSLTVAVAAYRQVYLHRSDSGRYSADCVWFNALMAVVFGGILLWVG